VTDFRPLVIFTIVSALSSIRDIFTPMAPFAGFVTNFIRGQTIESFVFSEDCATAGIFAVCWTSVDDSRTWAVLHVLARTVVLIVLADDQFQRNI
jgi:hypothetical protein